MKTTLIASLILCVPALAGDLNPPAGPVAPTFKTLTEVEPRTAINQDNTPGAGTFQFVIRNPGSYYLTADVTTDALKGGIEVLADDVTIDLNGFTMRFGGGAVGVGYGINAVDRDNITVRSGTLDGFLLACVETGDRAIIENVRAINGSAGGIDVGDHSIVKSCVAVGNGASGIIVGEVSAVTGCTASMNTFEGIGAGNSSTIESCTSSFNERDGIVINFSCTVRDNTCYRNGRNGILGINANRIMNNNCDRNDTLGSDGAGIRVTSSDNRIDSNNVTNNDFGIRALSSGNLVIRNSASGNGSNYDVAPGNDVGTIQTSPVGAGPWDNFVF